MVYDLQHIIAGMTVCIGPQNQNVESFCLCAFSVSNSARSAAQVAHSTLSIFAQLVDELSPLQDVPVPMTKGLVASVRKFLGASSGT